MQTPNFKKTATFLAFSAGLLLNAGSVCSQTPSQISGQYGPGTYDYTTQASPQFLSNVPLNAYPSTAPFHQDIYQQQPIANPNVTMYTASRDMLPTTPSLSSSQMMAGETVTPPQTVQPTETKKDNPFTAFYKKVSASLKPSSSTSVDQNAKAPAPSAPMVSATTEEDDSEKNGSYISSILKPSSKKKEDVDDGQDLIAEMEQERSFSERDYVASATKAKKAASKNLYARGMEEEAAGNYQAAIRSYNGFIKANKKQTANGTLAAPYHRLALIAWKQQESEKADVYFRYGLKYANGGNIPVIAGDYSLFLIDQGRSEQAEIILRNTLLHYPKDQRLILSLGRCVARRDKPVEAIRYLSSTLGEEQAYQELAMIYHEQGNYEMSRQMQVRREEYLAKSRNPYQPVPYQQYVGTMPENRNNAFVNAPLPTTPPPVMENPRSMTAHATLTPSIPFPTLSDPGIPSNAPSVQADSFTSPASSPVWPEAESSFIIPTNNPEAALDVPKAPPMPVSKVFHYPANSPQPIYHQYIGDQYPQTVPNVAPQETSQAAPRNGYYMMSTVPPNTAPSYPTATTVDPVIGYGAPTQQVQQTPVPAAPTAAQPNGLSPWASSVSQPQLGGYPPTYRSGNLSAQPAY